MVCHKMNALAVSHRAERQAGRHPAPREGTHAAVNRRGRPMPGGPRTVRPRAAVRALAARAIAGTLAVALLGPAVSAAESADAAPRKAVEHCRELIRPCQLSDGLIRMRADGEIVRGVPYFANIAAVALLAPRHRQPESSDVGRVRRWLAWYAAHQKPDGTVHKYSGTVGCYARTEKLDTTDTSASLYLLALNRYRKASRDRHLRARFGVSAIRAIEAVRSLVDPTDGLTWARPGNRNKYLMDNVLVSLCMADAAELLEAMGDRQRATEARQIRRGISESVARFLPPGAGHFAWAIGAGGRLSTGLDLPYPHQRANLYALAHLEAVPQGLWPRLRDACPTDRLVMTTRSYFAARRVGSAEDRTRFRSIVLEQARSLRPDNCDVFEPALAILVLTDDVAL